MREANEPSWKTNPRCDEEQLAMLRRCSEAKDMTEWNEWRDGNREVGVWLQGAGLWRAHLEGADVFDANLEGVDLRWAHLAGADLDFASLEGAYLTFAHLEGSGLSDARLEGAYLAGAHLEGARLADAHLEGARLWRAHLEGVCLEGAVVNGDTLFDECSIDRGTDFEGVVLDVCRVLPPGFKTAITHNLRESRWRSWYGKWPHLFYKWPVWLFWQMSDYGRSVGRIGLWFIALSVVFAAVYFTAAVARPPGIINNFLADENGCVSSPAMGMLRAFYFSIVTMTTLGFGDMYARVDKPWGHVLLMLQVVAGYFLLGVLVSRVTIAFHAVGPAQPLAKPPPRRRLVKWAIVAAVCLVLAVGGWIWHGWAVSKWPEVQQKARQAANAADAPAQPADTDERGASRFPYIRKTTGRIGRKLLFYRRNLTVAVEGDGE